MAPPLSPERDLSQTYDEVNQLVARQQLTNTREHIEGGLERDTHNSAGEEESDDEVRVDPRGRVQSARAHAAPKIPLKPYMSLKKNFFVCQKGSSGMAAKVNHNKGITDVSVDLSVIFPFMLRLFLAVAMVGFLFWSLSSVDALVMIIVMRTCFFHCFHLFFHDATNEILCRAQILEKLEATAKATGDHWRSYAYRKAITALKNHPRELTRVEEARAVRGVGERIADKIAEILETGKLRKADVKDEYVQAVELFSKVCAGVIDRVC